MLRRLGHIPIVRIVAVVLAVGTVTAALVTAATAVAAQPHIVPQTTKGSPKGPLVVTIGDSIMAGHGLTPAEAWPALLAVADEWRVTNLASDGSGFVAIGDERDTFANQVSAAIALHPDVIIVEGSSNDVGVSNTVLEAATDSTIAHLRQALPKATLIGLSAVWGDTAPPSQLADIDDQVDSAVTGNGGYYLNVGQPLGGHADLMQSDDVHPTASGQRTLAQAVSEALTASAIRF
ncbi:MAG: SGNH/GDSL hydrolase family protein [Microbacteriaceae bacterium]|nr:MAG: SGNH/GDSL hydrolase family protein [Microbacteriaceae bacterium]